MLWPGRSTHGKESAAPEHRQIVKLLRWCIGLLIVILLYVGSLKSELERLEKAVAERARDRSGQPSAAEIAEELRQKLRGPLFAFEHSGQGQNAGGITSTRFRVSTKKGFASHLTVTASDGVQAEIKPATSGSEATTHTLEFSSKPMPTTWTFTLHFTTALGESGKQSFTGNIHRNWVEPALPSQ